MSEESVDDLATAVDPAGSADPAVGAIVEAIAAAEALPLGEQPARFHDLYGRLAAELEDQ